MQRGYKKYKYPYFLKTSIDLIIWSYCNLEEVSLDSTSTALKRPQN
jgi:hypothetical protein